MKALIIVGALVIITGAVIFGTGALDKNTEIDGVIESSLFNLFESDSFKIDGSLTLDVDVTQQGQQQQLTAGLNFQDNIDMRDRENIKSSGTLNISIEGEGMSFSASLEDIVIGDNIYFKVTSLPAFLPIPIDLSTIKNQWFFLDTKSISEMIQQESPSFDKEQSKEIFKDLFSVMRGKDLFKIEKEIEKNHYLVSLKKEAIKEVGIELFSVMEKYVPEEQKENYKVEVEKAKADFPSQVDKLWEQINGIEFEAWITDSYLSKLKWQKNIDLTEIEDLKDKVTQGNIDVIFELQFSDLNKKFNIEAPQDPTPIEDLIASLFSSFMPQDLLPTE